MHSGELRHAFGAALLAAAALAGCAGTNSRFLPQSTTSQNAQFATYDAVMTAYEAIAPGRTPAAQLPSLGFDVASTPNVEVLNYLGVIERFMPRESIRIASLAAPVRRCIAARQGCTGYIFKPNKHVDRREGNVVLDALSFRRLTVTTGWSAEVLVLVQNGTVTYKLFSGQPRQDGTQLRVQPLGPVQDLTNTASGAVAGAVTGAAFQ
jgi:hypothetical protein